MRKNAVVWVNWGNSQGELLRRSIASVESNIDADLFLISDVAIDLPPAVKTVLFSFQESGYSKKPEALAKALPAGYDTYLFLDADTVVLRDVSLGFDKAAKFGIALAPAPTYSLDEYHLTGTILERESVPLAGQLLYNSGVMFFSNRIHKTGLLERWLELCQKHQNVMRGDQEMLTIAMEILGINPYCLSKSYNTRGRYEPIIGTTRIWHQRSAVPPKINDFGTPYPPRILARGRLMQLRLKDTYGGGLMFFRRNLRLLAGLSSARFLLKKTFEARGGF
jgi:hypothetical protein